MKNLKNEKYKKSNVIASIGDASSSLIETVSNDEYNEKTMMTKTLRHAIYLYAHGYKKINGRLQ